MSVLGLRGSSPYRGSSPAIKMGSNPVNHPRAKHLDTSYHYVRKKVEEGAIRLEYIPTDQMVADGLTKPLESGKFLRIQVSHGTSFKD